MTVRSPSFFAYRLRLAAYSTSLSPLPLVKVWVVTELEVPFFTAMAFTVVVSLRVKASL